MLLRKDNIKAYLARGDFLQKSKDIPDKLNDELMRVMYLIVKKSLLHLESKNGKSLRREQALAAIESLPEIPKGYY